MPRWSWFLLWTVLCSGTLGVFGTLAVHLGRRAAALGREILRAAELLGDALPAPEHPAGPEPSARPATARNRPGRNTWSPPEHRRTPRPNTAGHLEKEHPDTTGLHAHTPLDVP